MELTHKRNWLECIYYGLFVLVFFLMSNFAYIGGGLCHFSACNSDIAQSGHYDLFLVSDTNRSLAPTIVLLDQFAEGRVLVNPDGHRGYENRHFIDYDDDPFVGSGISDQDRGLFWWYLLIKLLVLLSFPLWILYAHIIRKLAELIFERYDRVFLKLVSTLLVLLLLLILYIPNFDQNYESVTWKLLDPACCHLREGG